MSRVTLQVFLPRLTAEAMSAAASGGEWKLSNQPSRWLSRFLGQKAVVGRAAGENKEMKVNQSMAALNDWNTAFDRITSQQGWTDQELLEAIHELIFGQPNPALDEQDEDNRAAVVLLAALHRGTDVTRLARLTGYPIDFIQQIADRMQLSGIWKGEVVEYHWEKGLAAFSLDSLVALGTFVRLKEKKNGRFVYRLVDTPTKRPCTQ